MSIVCCICGKKQSGWIIEYPLSPELNEYKICAKCGEKYQKIQSADKLEDVFNEIDYIKDKLKENVPDEKVINFFNTLFNENNKEKSVEDINNEIINHKKDAINNVIITSGFNFEGHKIINYHDYITSETVLGVGVLKALFASISSLTGTESIAFNNKINEAKNNAIYNLKKSAIEIGANAIIGIDIKISTIADSMVIILASGTAVTIV